MLKRSENFFNNLKRKSEFVYYHNDMNQIINRNFLNQIKQLMINKDMLQFRICLHHNDDENVQSMIIFYRKGFELDFIWQDKGIVQYNHLEGLGKIICLSENGKEISLKSSKSNPLIKLNASQTRKVMPVSDFWIFSEIAEGPFNPENTKRLNNA